MWHHQVHNRIQLQELTVGLLQQVSLVFQLWPLVVVAVVEVALVALGPVKVDQEAD
jgi:hypothetical protein